MNILVTGASGFIGTIVTEKLIKKGHKVYALSRHPPGATENLVPLAGDVTEPDLGLTFFVPKDIHAVYHLAGIHSLRPVDRKQLIWKTNVDGTHNVLEFCVRNDISRLFFTSTAYTWPVNPYGCSKIRNEEEISQFVQKHGLKVTIFKPSIVMGSEQHPYPGHFAQFIMGLVKMNKRVESVRRRVEGVLRLPILEPAFRIKGNPEGLLNLVPIDAVAQAITETEEEGTFWLTNPQPPKIGDLAEWVGEVIRMRLYIQRDFRANPIEAMFRRKASAFLPYLWGDAFPSDLPSSPSPTVTKEFIQNTARALIA